MAAVDEPVQHFDDILWEDLVDQPSDEGTLTARIDHLAERTIGEHDTPFSVERSYAIRNGLKHCFKLAAARFESNIRFAELDCRAFDGAAAAFKIRRHVIEAADQLAQLFGRAFVNAMRVIF